jgi:hypothetical protein
MDQDRTIQLHNIHREMSSHYRKIYFRILLFIHNVSTKYYHYLIITSAVIN